ncbi:hypothetical protein LSAT2_021916 [Lamellibrachia satsuma]|nr:hypothetical protein LSAT2_021916 [Lamellibrachia satsuma]
MLFGVVLSVVALAQSIDTIGANPLTCVTFDLESKIEASNGVYQESKDIDTTSCTGADNKCGVFGGQSRVSMPFFNRNSFFDLTISLWFKRDAGYGQNDMTLINSAMCDQSPIVIVTSDKFRVYVVVRTSTTIPQYTPFKYSFLVHTPSQVANFVHVVFTFSVSRNVDELGRARVYINGHKVKETPVKGKIMTLPGPMNLGSDLDCGGLHGFYGKMDSVSFARTELSASDVMKLYNSPASCIGGQLGP